MKAILILLDSVNRRFLECYGNTWVQTPNLSRLASRSTVFERHFVGSAPCMPARHDILTGRLEFLEHNWCGIQPYDYTLPQALRALGTYSHMETDHYHYFHVGGENYPFLFDSWGFTRGQEHDVLVPRLGRLPDRPHYGCFHSQYDLNRARFLEEADYPTPHTMRQAAEFVSRYHEEDNWFLFVDGFDPHEPFDVPGGFSPGYQDDYEDKLFYWPQYAGTEGLPQHAVSHIRKQYAKTLSMADRWLGKILDQMDKYCLWDDTMVIFTTDHGFLLGERELLGKNYMPAYNEVYHIPLIIHMPGQNIRKQSQVLSQNIDLFPTILEFFGGNAASCPDKLHGRSLLAAAKGDEAPLRDAAIYGMFGRQVNVTDGQYTYFRSAVRADNTPISIYTAMPTTINHYWDREHVRDVGKIEMGHFLTWTDYPVFRIPGTLTNLSDPSHRFDVRYEIVAQNMLFDLQTDERQMVNLCGTAEESRMAALLRKAMSDHDSPDEQYERLGLL